MAETETDEPVQLTIGCTCDEHCQALADEHDDDCPVEQQLLAELGF